MNTPRRFTSVLLPALLACSATASAQHSPLIERMAETPVATTAQAATPQATPSVASKPAPAQIGDATRAALRMQAEGSHAGNALPMLGETASRSYQRYLNSFDHAIPEYFEATLPSAEQGSNR